MVFSTMCSSINFNNLSTEGYAAFVLALIFTIVSMAGFIYFARHKDAGKVILILTTLVFPVLAIFCWTYLIMNIYSYSIAFSLGIAFGTSLGYAVVAICLALIIEASIKANQKKKAELESKKEEEASNVVETSEEETTEEVKEEAETTEETEETENDDDQKLLSAPETEETVVLLEENLDTAETTEEVKEETEPTEPTEQGVIFSNEPKKTFDEQFSELDADRQGYFKEILEYAMEKPQTKCSNAKYHKTVKIGSMKLLDAKFSKEALLCNFMAGSSELKYYSKKEKNVKIKEKPVIIEIDSAECVPVAKNMIDIVFKNISDAKEEMVEDKKAKRRKTKKVTEEKPESTKNTETEQASETNE